MICSISGEVPKEPVISPKSGAIFDRSYIINYLSTTGKDPINDEPLTADELIAINTTVSNIVPPRPPRFNSIPSLLSAFQNEWDSIALEVFTLRKQLHKAREELSAALYHHDAAVRVAARALKERDEAKSALQQLAISIGKGEIEEEEKQMENGRPLIPIEAINQARDELFQLHKSQKLNLAIAPEMEISIEYATNHIQPFKKVCSTYLKADNKTLLIGSPTGSVAIYDFNNPGKDNVNKITHKGQVTSLNYISYEDELLPIIAFEDHLVVGNNKLTFEHEQKEIVQILTHPKLTNLFIILSKDSWSLNDIRKATLFKSSELPKEITAGDIHVDGALIAVGTNDGNIIIYNIPTTESVFTLTTKYPQINKVKFALNGYWLLVASSNDSGSSILEVIDLRKNVVIYSIEFDDELLDFIIDPSSTLIITYDISNRLKLHRFIKKGKKWMNNLAERLIKESKSSIKKIEMLTDVNDEEFINNSKIKFIGITENSTVLEYELSYS